MPYPDRYFRRHNFKRDADGGVTAPNAAKLDAEFNALVVSIQQTIDVLRGIVTADGALKNLAASTAQALAGAQRFVATSGQTVFDTTITYVSAFTSLNVMVDVAGTRLDSSVITVGSYTSGLNTYLRVTLPAQTLNAVVIISAFESGAGLLTDLQSTSSVSKGAVLVGVNDAGGLIAATTVEGALQELATSIATLTTNLGTIANLVRTDVAKTMAVDLTFSLSKTIKGLRASAANGEAVRHEQLQAVITTLNGVTSAFLSKAGGTMTGAISMGSQKITDLATPTAANDAANKTYVDNALLSFGGLPVGTVIDYAGSGTPTGWLVCDGTAVSRTTYANLFAIIGVAHGVGDGTTTFNLPDTQGRATIGTGAGSGLTVRALGDKVGAETHVLDVTQIPAHTHSLTVYADTGSAAVGDGGGATSASTTGSTGGGLGHNNMQPSIALKKLIKF